eukprot:COSAG04_NODE_11376_length_712_cov_9.368679_1_plen_68_part_00
MVSAGGGNEYAAATIQGSNIVESVQRIVSHDCVGAAQVRRVLLDSPWTGTTREAIDAAANQMVIDSH